MVLLLAFAAACGSTRDEERTATEGSISIASVRGPETEESYRQTDRLALGDIDITSTPPITVVEYDGALKRTTDGTIAWYIHLAELGGADAAVIAELEELLAGGPPVIVDDGAVLYLTRPDLLAQSIGSDPAPWVGTAGIVHLDQLDGRGIPMLEALDQLETSLMGVGDDPLSLLVAMGATLEYEGANGDVDRYAACGPAIDAMTWLVNALEPGGDNGAFLDRMEELVTGDFCSTIWLDQQMRVTRVRQSVDWNEIFTVPIDDLGLDEPMRTESTWEYRDVDIQVPDGPFEDFTDMFVRVLRNAG